MPALPICLYIIYSGYKRYRSSYSRSSCRSSDRGSDRGRSSSSNDKSRCKDPTVLGKDDPSVLDVGDGDRMQREIELSVEFSQFHINIVQDNRNEEDYHQYQHKNVSEEFL